MHVKSKKSKFYKKTDYLGSEAISIKFSLKGWLEIMSKKTGSLVLKLCKHIMKQFLKILWTK